MTNSKVPPNIFPGSTSVSHLSVYDWNGEDGLHGGSPHVHQLCTEGYVVIAGGGHLQTLSPDGYTETPLFPLTVVWFSPGTIHRLVNDGGLQIVVIMQNAGLPEGGDCVLTFPPEYLADPQTYRAQAALSSPDKVYTDSAAAAERRRNLAVRGFLALRERVEREGPVALDDFYRAAAGITRDQLPNWRAIWRNGARAAAERTGEILDLMEQSHFEHLHDARLNVVQPPAQRRLGMCGRLATYDTRP